MLQQLLQNLLPGCAEQVHAQRCHRGGAEELRKKPEHTTHVRKKGGGKAALMALIKVLHVLSTDNR